MTTSTRQPPLSPARPDPTSGTGGIPRSVSVVGAGLAGLSAVRALRAAGFEGRLTVIGAETRRPYDRPPLSKEILLGTLTEADISLERRGEDLGAEWLLGRVARSLAPCSSGGRAGHVVELADGERVVSDAVVIATGSRVRRLPGELAGVHTVRTLDDALALKVALQPGARLVVVGAGFVGSEVASVAHAVGLDVTVLEATDSPLSVPLGVAAGALVAGLHRHNGVRLRLDAPVSGLEGVRLEGSGSDGIGPRGRGHVSGVRLADGDLVPADLVVVGIGAVADVDWLAGAGLRIGPDGVRCDHTGFTGVPGVYAVGDCAAWHDPVLERYHRIEHWTDAKDRGGVVAAAMLGTSMPATIRPPYFWSDQYGVKIQFAGRRRGDEEFVIEAGGEPESLLASYRRSGEVSAVLAVGRQPEFMRMRKRLSVPFPPTGASGRAD